MYRRSTLPRLGPLVSISSHSSLELILFAARSAKLTHEYNARSRVVLVYESTYVMTVRTENFNAFDVQIQSYLNTAYRS